MIPRQGGGAAPVMAFKLSRRQTRRHVSGHANSGAGLPGPAPRRRAARRHRPGDPPARRLAYRRRAARPAQARRPRGPPLVRLGFHPRHRGGVRAPARPSLHRQGGALPRTAGPADALAGRLAGGPAPARRIGGTDGGEVRRAGPPAAGRGAGGHPEAGEEMEKRVLPDRGRRGGADRARLLRQRPEGDRLRPRPGAERECRSRSRETAGLLRADPPARATGGYFLLRIWGSLIGSLIFTSTLLVVSGIGIGTSELKMS